MSWNKFVAIILLGILGLFGYELSRILAVPVNSWTMDQRGDCAIVVTGGPGRVREGFDLLAQGAVKKLIISGVNPQVRLRDIFPTLPYYGTVNESDVILERRSRTTYGNARQSLALVEAFQCRDVVLVTSRLHMRRAYRTFRGEFPSEINIQQRTVVGGSLKPELSDLMVETIKSIFYFLLDLLV